MPSVNLNEKKQLDHPVKSGNHGYSLKTSEKVETLGDDMPRNSVKHSKSPTYQLPTALVESEIPRLRSGTPCRGIATIAFFGHVADGNSPISGSVVKLSEIAAKTWGNDLVTRSPFQTLGSGNLWIFKLSRLVLLCQISPAGNNILPAWLIHVEMVRAALVLVCASLQPSRSMNCWWWGASRAENFRNSKLCYNVQMDHLKIWAVFSIIIQFACCTGHLLSHNAWTKHPKE